MIKILISACLMGERVRYDGSAGAYQNIFLQKWQAEGRLLNFCPEVAGGLPVPRSRAEIIGGDGFSVVQGYAKVKTINGRDVTRFYLAGAQKALTAVDKHGIRLAVMKEKSPSCGSVFVHDGRFSGRLIKGRGVAAALLEKKGIRVFGESQIDEAMVYLEGLSAADISR